MYVLVDLGFVNCTFQESPKPGPDQARKSLRNQSAFFVDVFVTLYKQTDLKVKTQILQMHTNAYKSYDLVLEITEGLAKLILTILPVDEICLCRIFLAEINWLLPDCERTKQWKQHSMTRERMVFHHNRSTRRERTVADCNCITYCAYMHLSNAPSLTDVCQLILAFVLI